MAPFFMFSPICDMCNKCMITYKKVDDWQCSFILPSGYLINLNNKIAF